jgi:small-conductance mechanosensitive channel
MHRLNSRARIISSVLLLALAALVVGAAAAERGASGVAGAPAPVPPGTQPIALAEVATKAAETATLLRTLAPQSADPVEIQTIARQIPETIKLIESEQAKTGQGLEDRPSFSVLAGHQQRWKERHAELGRWLALLTQHATVLQDSLNRLTAVYGTWRETRATAVASRAPATLLQQIDETLAAVQTLHVSLGARRGRLLGLQAHLVPAAAQCESVLARITQAQQQAVGGMLVPDAPPIWSPELWAQTGLDVVVPAVRRIGASWWESVLRYAQGLATQPAGHLIAFLMLLALALAAWFHARRPRGPEVTASGALNRPFAVAFLIPLLLASSPTSGVPNEVRLLVLVLSLVPVVRLVGPVVHPRAVRGLYALAGLFSVDALGQIYTGTPVVEQALLAMEMATGAGLLVYALRIDHVRTWAAPGTEEKRLALLRAAVGAVAVLLAAALAAGALGFMRPARLLASGVVGSAALALTLYAVIRVLASVTALVLTVRPLRTLRMVQQHRSLIERRTTTVLAWGAAVGWLLRSLDYVGLLDPALSVGRAVYDARLHRGAISLSLGDVVELALTLWLAYLASVFIRFVLEEDIYPRTRMPRGLSYAVSSVINYVVLLLGFVLGLAALGVDFTKVGLLAGALGVGIGFGLQGIVNNFVSGLILLFERPIQVGDIIEVGDLTAEVRRIGTRASTVRTFQNAEIIVPNSKLVSEQVTNWTRKERRRRVDLPVGVDYGSHPGKVMEVLEAAARRHPGVAAIPAPQAFFIGFGDSAMNFQLHCWTQRFEDWFQLRSELGVAVYEALAAAGMSFAFPRRDVRVLGGTAGDQPSQASEPSG